MVMDKLGGKTAIITGGASGMGLVTTKLFLAEGANVVIADLSVGASAPLIDQPDGRCRFIACDVRDEANIARMCAETAQHFGSIDILFNNAGYLGMKEGIATMTATGWDETFSGLLRGPALAMHHALPWLKRNGGAIINTASTAGVDIGWGPMAYSMAKHALIYLTKWAAAELSEYDIRVNAITPGLILTPLLGSANGVQGLPPDTLASSDHIVDIARRFQPLRRAGKPADIAEAALYLASDAAAFVTGTNLMVDGGGTLGERHVWDPETPSPAKELRNALAELRAPSA